MWIVKIGTNSRHSAWNTRKEALSQVEVLKEYGLIKPGRRPGNFIEFDETVSCENGHYYV